MLLHRWWELFRHSPIKWSATSIPLLEGLLIKPILYPNQLPQVGNQAVVEVVVHIALVRAPVLVQAAPVPARVEVVEQIYLEHEFT